jgi:hypothetical protein
MMANWDRETRKDQASGMPSSSCRLPESFSDTQPVAARPVRLYLLSLAVDERPHITDENPFFSESVLLKSYLPNHLQSFIVSGCLKAFYLSGLVSQSVPTMRLSMVYYF